MCIWMAREKNANRITYTKQDIYSKASIETAKRSHQPTNNTSKVTSCIKCVIANKWNNLWLASTCTCFEMWIPTGYCMQIVLGGKHYIRVVSLLSRKILIYHTLITGKEREKITHIFKEICWFDFNMENKSAALQLKIVFEIWLRIADWTVQNVTLPSISYTVGWFAVVLITRLRRPNNKPKTWNPLLLLNSGQILSTYLLFIGWLALEAHKLSSQSQTFDFTRQTLLTEY